MNIYNAMGVPTPAGPDSAAPLESSYFPWRFEWPLFARMLTAARKTQGFTLRDCADIICIAPATLMRMEQGKSADLNSVVAACEFMGLMVDAFVSRPGHPDGHLGDGEVNG